MLSWLKRWGWVIAFIAVAVLIYVLTAGQKKLNIGAEVKAAKAEAKAEKLLAKMDRDAAVKVIEEEHRETIEKLDERQKKEAEVLRKDPRELSRWLARVGSG
jgi:hypothetical protein